MGPTVLRASVPQRIYLEIVVCKGEETSPSDSEVVSPLAREGWRLDVDDGTINLVQTLIYSSVNGVMTTLAPEVSAAG